MDVNSSGILFIYKSFKLLSLACPMFNLPKESFLKQ